MQNNNKHTYIYIHTYYISIYQLHVHTNLPIQTGTSSRFSTDPTELWTPWLAPANRRYGNTTIALRWMFAHSKMVSIGIDPSPYFDLVLGEILGHFSCNTHGVTWHVGNLQPSELRFCFVFPSSTNTELGNQPCLEKSSLPTLHLRQHLC